MTDAEINAYRHSSDGDCQTCPDDARCLELFEEELLRHFGTEPPEEVDRMNDEDTIILFCSFCGCEITMPRWMFEIDVEEEGDEYEPVCPDCMGETKS